ncbi:hypothetical protein L1987_47347 [Smallanthus sonchifolius]|uniref:Uncharacterized protein n=1 Tax=Smallanthus sonchifolius TaxID=185202 RepID=A0ACB9G2C2_9ASTR|nr:hypothetical protein L1987_47347 [Smallanthus sonchifolius]
MTCVIDEKGPSCRRGVWLGFPPVGIGFRERNGRPLSLGFRKGLNTKQRGSLMATKGNPGDNRTRRSFFIFIVVGLCCFFYLLGAWKKSGFGKGDSIAQEVTKSADCSVLSNLNVETHHGNWIKKTDDLHAEVKVFQPCDDRFVDYTPCHDQMRAMTFPRENMNYRERHCPPENEKLHCLIPAPKGLTVEKAIQNWIQYEGNVFRFPGGGTQFPHGADAYIDQLASVIPINNGMVRTALDTGCGVKPQFGGKENKSYCQERDSRVTMCKSKNADDVWYKEMEACVTPYPETNNADDVSGGELKPFPERLYDVPPRITSGSIPGISAELFLEDNKLWQKHLNAYKRVNKIIDSGSYRNIMDMNAGLGSFAAAIDSPKSWDTRALSVKGVGKITSVPQIKKCKKDSSADMCEAFSTYPRTYDLIHANGLFSLYKDKRACRCSYEDILIEMDRILRPEGTVIIRDSESEVMKVKRIVSGMRWNTKMVDSEDGPLVPEKILFAVKQYWVAGKNNTATSR